MSKISYEELEHQRKNPHLYTTLSQLVEPDGRILTYEDVTRNLRSDLDKLQKLHTKQFGGKHPVMCMRPVIGQPKDTVCQAIELINRDLDRVRVSFVENAQHVRLAQSQSTKQESR